MINEIAKTTFNARAFLRGFTNVTCSNSFKKSGGEAHISDLAPSTTSEGTVKRIANDGRLLGRRGSRGASTVWAGKELTRFVSLPEGFNAKDFNDRMTYVGTWKSSTGMLPAVYSSRNGVKVIPAPYGLVTPRAVNNKGVVTGLSRREYGEAHGFRWDPQNGLVMLDQLIGAERLNPFGVNDRGEIVGVRRDGDSGKAFIWSSEEGLADLPLDVARSSCARAINNHSQVVGHYQLDGRRFAFFWSVRNGIVNLESLLPAGSEWELHVAWDVNDRGQIVGYGRRNGEFRDFLLTLPNDLSEPNG